jgi:NAD(P)-dependent dehydrogenase (short-subunit alcohol dehydrogenase family)
LLALAKQQPLHAVICGRSSIPEAEPEEFRNVDNLVHLRELMLEQMQGETPARVERACTEILRAREFRSTLQQLESAGSTVDYVSIDVRDTIAFTALLDRLYGEHGKIDGVIHGAGVIEDKGLLRKDVESFKRVFDTKVTPARILADKLKDNTSFVAFFSSVSSAFGNRGQADYAAANGVLDQIANQLNQRLEGRVVSINWGPWGGTGMVSASLEKEYGKRGVGLIPPDEGVRAFLQELAMDSSAVSQVVWMCAKPEAMT